MNDLFKALSTNPAGHSDLQDTRYERGRDNVDLSHKRLHQSSEHTKQADLVASVRDSQNIISREHIGVPDLVSWVYTLQGKD